MTKTIHPGKVASLLFFSGACALIYQTVWLRDLRLIFGASTLATGAVLAIFMGGLGLGSAIFGRRADRHPRPLAFYGQLEMLIAVAAALTPLLLFGIRSAYIAAGGSVTLGSTGATLIRLVLTALVLLIPTVLMGGTLPAAARAVESSDDAGRRRLALLYGVNTIGAVAGTVLSTFYMLEHFGNRTTLLGAALLNLAVGALAFFIGKGIAVAEQTSAPVQEKETRSAGLHPQLVLIAAAVVGFVFLLMELVWYRMLSPLLGGTTFMFGLVLATALAGIGIGGAIYSLGRGERTASASTFTLTCILEGLAMMLPFAIGDSLALLANSLRVLNVFGFTGYVVSWFIVTAIVVLPAALIAGYQFPLLISLLGRGRENVGHEVGLTYAWNTGGSIAASLLGSFVLIPKLGAIGSWRLGAILLASLASVTFVASLREKKWLANTIAVAAAVALMLTLGAEGPTAVWRHAGIGVGRVPESLATDGNLRQEWIHNTKANNMYEADGRESSISLNTDNDLALMINGKSDGSARGDAGTQVMSGLLGAILHPHAKRSLVVGLGTGSTAGWLGRVPTMQVVDVVELEPVVVDIAKYFDPVNGRVLENAKVNVVIGDAREVLLTNKQKYDLIFSEPSNPYRAGVASLFTREYYEAAASQLNARGLFLQWVQTYATDAVTIKTIYATLSRVFPYVHTWTTGPGDMLLVASREPIIIDADVLRQRLAGEPYRTASHVAWRAESAEAFLSHFLAAERFAERAAERVNALNTDDRQIIEFSFARALYSKGVPMAEIPKAAERLGAARPETRGEIDWNLVEQNRASIAWLQRNSDARGIFAAQHQARDYEGAYVTFKQAGFEPVNSLDLMRIAHVLAGAGDAEAAGYIERLRKWRPVEADAAEGILLVAQDRIDEAAAAFERSFSGYREDPWAHAELMQSATLVVLAIGQDRPIFAARMLEAFAKPFSAWQLETRRRADYLRLAFFAQKCGTVTLAAFQEVEPNFPWDLTLLNARAACYKAARLKELAERAESDRKLYRKNLPAPLITISSSTR